jgi:histidinol-phosphate aminotransferase
MKLPVPDYILGIKPYVPGKPIEELERQYGIKDSIKLASNENPIGPSPKAVSAIQDVMVNLNRYPDDSGYNLVRKIAKKINVLPENIVIGNGSDEIIGMIARAFLKPGDEAIVPYPTFLMYEIMTQCVGATSLPVPLRSLSIDLNRIKERLTPSVRLIILCNPNNPTGSVIKKSDFETFIQSLPSGVVVVLDEAYMEFVRDPDCVRGITYLASGLPVIILRTFSKAYGLAGLRIGYSVAPQEISDLLNRVRQPFNTSLPAQVGAVAALDDDLFLKKTIDLVHEGIDYLYDALSKIGVNYFETQANFLLIDVKKNADDVYEEMLKQGVIVRSMTSYGYPSYIRVNVGLDSENKRFIEALKKVV